MQTTTVFDKNAAAYGEGHNLIINQGGTSSSKTYSVLQLLFLIALYSTRKLIISVVSYTFPHLRLGAMRDFENILLKHNIIPDEIHNKSEGFYKVGKSIIEFFSADNLGKVHGPRRDLLYVNEANYMKKYSTFEQLVIRTRGTVFADFNPTAEFWMHTEVIPNEPNILIKSTYLDNNLLEQSIIDKIERKKHNENWWRVYGLGEIGRLEGAILTNWKFGDFNKNLPFGYGLDFGTKDPDALVKVAVDKKNKKLYWKQELYKNGLSTESLYKAIKLRVPANKIIIADSAGKRTILDLHSKGINIRKVKKDKIVEDVKLLMDYEIIVHPDSFDLAKELNNWVWLDKKGEVPLDDFNHLIDAARYYSKTVLKPNIFKGINLLN